MLTQSELDSITQRHKSSISAENAIVQLLNEIRTGTGSPAATESTLLDILANLDQGRLKTTGVIRPTISGNLNSVAPTFYSVSIANVGAANGTVLGAVIKPGEVFNFSADAVNNYFNTLAYDATGTEFIIIYVTN